MKRNPVQIRDGPAVVLFSFGKWFQLYMPLFSPGIRSATGRQLITGKVRIIINAVTADRASLAHSLESANQCGSGLDAVIMNCAEKEVTIQQHPIFVRSGRLT